MKNIFLCCLLAQSLFGQLPGRLGSEGISYAKFGDCEIFFYMGQEKYMLANEIKECVNEDMMITLGQAALPCPTREIMVQAIKYPERDPKGTAILADYAKGVHAIAEKNLKLKIIGLTWHMNLNCNWEALKIHHDQFVQQYHVMEKNNLSPHDYTLVQDLTLIDWQMGKGTIAGTMIQDGRAGDRYIVCLFPNEVVGTFYTEPSYKLSLKTPTTYPGHITMPPHSTIAPMDYEGHFSCGSSKGKRMSTAVRGIVQSKEISQLKTHSQELPLNRKQHKMFQHGPGVAYFNGITVQPLSDKFSKVYVASAHMLGEKKNIICVELAVEDNAYAIEHIASLFDIPLNEEAIKIVRLTKTDTGFSPIPFDEINSFSNPRVILVNSSKIPPGYRYFNLAQNSIKQGLPWIQLYELYPGNAMEVPISVLKYMTLSPCEELIYRNESTDEHNAEYSEHLPKIVTHVDMFIFGDASHDR